jgi:hypothetical protein
MKRHMAGKPVRGARVMEIAQPDVRAIREAAKISQSRFAKLIACAPRAHRERKMPSESGPPFVILRGTQGASAARNFSRFDYVLERLSQ